MAIVRAEVGSAAILCEVPRLGTPLRIPGLLVLPANMTSVVTAQESWGPHSGHVQASCVCIEPGSPW